MKLGIVSDIHGQPRVLERALAAMAPFDRLVCLGDAVSQTRFCAETVGLLHAHDPLAILGNHEQLLFSGPAAPSGDLADWLATRPSTIETTLAGRCLHIVHSTPWDSGHAYIPGHHRDFHRFAVPGADLVLYGHTHQPLVRWLGDVLVVNPGSVGEGRPTADGFVRSCAVVDLATMAAEILDLD
ncbi:metallophosphoesterase family protein [Novosphingobium sp. ERN07]|uniref:metallophosphoesterase family protein n=1 Tax=Novosphingobium sp. ERN07 TaxID=2726187 RepID=UPI00145640D7|nr:metallophosphoesterase family protein [Novosphingobium sp. ERN07]NLR72986.1 metallophosphoesterase family protein [Novosphingobium sp. ERN07]